MMRDSCIWIRGQFIARHVWPLAPEVVSFLRYPHRHVFYVKVTLPVKELDRELEFFVEKKKLDAILLTYAIDVAVSKSCETFADEIAQAMKKHYPNIAYIDVEVSEDNESGAIVRLSENQV